MPQQHVAQIKKVLFIKYVVRLHYIAFFIKDLDCLKGKRLQRRRRNVCAHIMCQDTGELSSIIPEKLSLLFCHVCVKLKALA